MRRVGLAIGLMGVLVLALGGVALAGGAPQISAPASIAGSEDTAVALSGISFTDAGSGDAPETVTLDVPVGTIGASGSGLVVTGTGSDTVTLRGTIADLNAAFAGGGVTYTDAPDDNGSHTLTVTIDDGGDGGADPQSATTTVTLDIAAVNDAPVVTAPGAQQVDQDHALTFSTAGGDPVSVSDVDGGDGTERVTLTASGGVLTLSGTDGLTFSVGSGRGDPTMTFDGTLADLDAALDGLTFQPTAGSSGAASVQITIDDLGLTGSGGALSATATVPITVVPPNPQVIAVSSPRPDGAYRTGAAIAIALQFNRAVAVDTTGGTPTLAVANGNGGGTATYTSGSGTATITFTYFVAAGDAARALDVASASALALNGGAITSAATGDPALLTLPAPGTAGSLSATRTITIDGIPPAVTSVDVPAPGQYAVGWTLDLQVHFAEPVLVAGGTPAIPVGLGGMSRDAVYVAGSGATKLTFRLVVAPGDLAPGGIAPAAAIAPRGATLRDRAGNDASLTLTGLPSTSGVVVDTAPPAVASFTHGSGASWTLTFTEPVSGVDASDFALAASGGIVAGAVSVTRVDAATYTVTVDGVAGSGSVAPVLVATGSGIADAAGNVLAAGASAEAYILPAPLVVAQSPPATTTPQPAPAPAPGATAPRPRIVSARLAAACTRSSRPRLVVRALAATRLEVRIDRLVTTGRAPRTCAAAGALSPLRPGARLATKRLRLTAGTTTITLPATLRPGAYLITLTALSSDARSTPVTRRVRVIG